MDVVMGFEGRTTVDGRTILPGAIYWGDLPLPIFAFESGPYSMEGFRNAVGKITALKREGTLIIATMDIDLPTGYTLSIDGSDSEIEYGEDEEGNMTWTFKKLRIVAGTLIPISAWAWEE